MSAVRRLEKRLGGPRVLLGPFGFKCLYYEWRSAKCLMGNRLCWGAQVAYICFSMHRSIESLNVYWDYFPYRSNPLALVLNAEQPVIELGELAKYRDRLWVKIES
ncbi:uncharacterized protein G2W53_035185 [Senna tora]|uniref:Uncharacterized protein n=1 Tax=Senna tora TaxID=362788 RepID=A0A834SVD1_9FABA|nr:uncharacterized protein G2W53_035185 [Senna tora]